MLYSNERGRSLDCAFWFLLESRRSSTSPNLCSVLMLDICGSLNTPHTEWPGSICDCAAVVLIRKFSHPPGDWGNQCSSKLNVKVQEFLTYCIWNMQSSIQWCGNSTTHTDSELCTISSNNMCIFIAQTAPLVNGKCLTSICRSFYLCMVLWSWWKTDIILIKRDTAWRRGA